MQRKNDPIVTSMLTAIVNKNIASIKSLLADGFEVDRPLFEHSRESPLHHALAGHLNAKEVFEVFLAAGADVNLLALSGETPLMVAVRKGQGREVLAMLVDAGADVSLRYKDGLSLLHCAASLGNAIGQAGKPRPDCFDPEICRFLIDAGVDLHSLTDPISSPLDFSMTALHFAGCAPAWDFFVAAGISPDYIPPGADSAYLTPAQNLVVWRSLGLVRHVVDRGELDVRQFTLAGKDLLAIANSTQISSLLRSLRTAMDVEGALPEGLPEAGGVRVAASIL